MKVLFDENMMRTRPTIEPELYKCLSHDMFNYMGGDYDTYCNEKSEKPNRRGNKELQRMFSAEIGWNFPDQTLARINPKVFIR